MQVIAGERSVTIRMSYEVARFVRNLLPRSTELYQLLTDALKEGKAKGRPYPPLPKGEVAHNSPVEIVEVDRAAEATPEA